MKTPDYYQSLPDGMPPQSIRDEFEAILLAPDDMATLPLTEALYELADRQWHTYSLLDEALKGRLEQLLISRWRDDLEITENLLSIVSRLGLVGVWEFLLGLDKQRISAATREAIDDAVAEMADSIADPYSGMR
ncbi:hypothetical protein [Pseudomonas urmiensis]|jgi:hypothetical protein|uniref:hypothetical protein n=1 Tax=Pseudomonas urmiensis TaxID=2745493 RepID=UPI0034D4F23D